MSSESFELSGTSPYAFYAFYTLYNYLNSNDKSHSLNSTKKFLRICQTLYPGHRVNPFEKTSLFITWNKKSKKSGKYNLRGCIGTFARPALVQGIEKYSLVAALQDSRFPQISKSELPLLKCSCNILQNFTTIYEGSKGDINDWEVGLHGIELLFKDPKSGITLSATFLPEVMSEQNWDKEETFLNLIYKAGVSSHLQEVLDHYEQYFVQVIRYEGNKSAITYEQFESQLEKLK
ncbi:hypothetical protein ZYGM_001264 [Zygosaccharomyces mellis]|uniref:AMMECR1 domain-containing protein n=1 Tax=Zygosaccharomyces mellis TaxID=42258 RepID=A0A4C2E6Z5_9SACH|nr:hypothetical protein ZYGM_001264 [Zygosaccharomyces mellis]